MGVCLSGIPTGIKGIGFSCWALCSFCFSFFLFFLKCPHPTTAASMFPPPACEKSAFFVTSSPEPTRPALRCHDTIWLEHYWRTPARPRLLCKNTVYCKTAFGWASLHRLHCDPSIYSATATSHHSCWRKCKLIISGPICTLILFFPPKSPLELFVWLLPSGTW